MATFECLGLSWSPAGASAERTCSVQYRLTGATSWKQALPLWFDEHDEEYRGSIVHLTSGADYEVQLALAESDVSHTLTATTWPEEFPIGRTVYLPDGVMSTPLEIGDDYSGSRTAYTLITPQSATTATIDVAAQADYCIRIAASYVVLRGLVLRGAGRHAIQLDDGHDIVIEQCDISGWGRSHEDGWGENYDSAVYSRSESLERIVVQRNRIHHPRSDSNNWDEHRVHRDTYHPMGPQAVCFFNSRGNHVIRYNTVYSDADHYYNDIIGAGSNYSDMGFPNRDSDIYGNYLANCWDDAIEAEGANRNVRIWGNYIEDCFVAIATAATSVGPLYVWRNVYGSARTGDVKPWNESGRGGFLKTSDGAHVEGDIAFRGRIFVFHNTLLQPSLPDVEHLTGASVGMGWGGPMLNTISRNNILHVYRSSGTSIVDKKQDPLGDYDYDLYNGKLRAADGVEPHGIRGVPVYDPVNADGEFALDPSSPGYDAGAPIPNFNDVWTGFGPDVGAHERGAPAMQFGVDAYILRSATR